MSNVKMEAIKINVFGSESKYRSMVLEIEQKSFDITDENCHFLAQLIGRTVYVNYPMSHEAKVVAVSTHSFEYRAEDPYTVVSGGSTTTAGGSGSGSGGGGAVSAPAAVRIDYDKYTSEKWRLDSIEEVSYTFYISSILFAIYAPASFFTSPDSRFKFQNYSKANIFVPRYFYILTHFLYIRFCTY